MAGASVRVTHHVSPLINQEIQPRRIKQILLRALCRLCSEGRPPIPKPLRRCRSLVCCVKALCKLQLKLNNTSVLA